MTDGLIPLDAVADDARPLIQAFRSAGSVSFQDVDLTTSRRNYLLSCRANGPTNDAPMTVTDANLAGVRCRVYRPMPEDPDTSEDGASAESAILFFHGGGWVIGDLDTHDLLCRYLADSTGTSVVAVDYRLAPEHAFPAAHDDSIAVAQHLLRTGDLGDGSAVDPARIAVVGDSAGANLVAWIAAESARGAFAHEIMCQVLFYPVTDLTFSQPSHLRITAGFPLSASSMRWFANAYVPQPHERAHASVSPLLHPPIVPQAPAFLCTVGLDPLADEGIAYAGELARAGTAVEHHHLPRHAHGLVTSAGKIGTGLRVLDRAAHFIRSNSKARS